ncbi:fatty acid cis/trans isomerase [Petrachloros mirabilis]
MQKRVRNLSRRSRLLSSAMFLLGPVVLGSFAASAEEISFTQDIKPILDTKCVSCHACYDAPAQLDLRSVAGIQRGAIKLDPYAPRTSPVPPTFVWNSKNTLEDWRKLGFFSVTEGGKDSIMGKMLRLGHENPVEPNERFSDKVELDPFKRKFYFPNSYEIDAYIAQKPREGMPLAVSGLLPSEYANLIQWLEEGAKFDHKVAEPSEVDLGMISNWEGFLNGEDARTQLMARYIYEHIYLVTFLFENKEDANFYTLVRSTTPPGEPVVPVAQHVANGPVAEGDFYYRFMLLDQTRCVKNTRLQMVADDKKLNRWKEIFDEQEWTAQSLPGYSEEERYDILGIFKDIPPKVRYKFLLDNTWNIRGAIVHGPSCHGNQAIGSVQDQGWHFYENPETSLYVNDPEYRAMVDPLLSFYINKNSVQDAFITRHEFVGRRKKYMKLRMEREQELGIKTQMTDIWRGEDDDDTPIVTVYRHQTDAYTLDPKVAAGDYPKESWLIDLPIFEQAYYTAVTNYDLFDSSDSWTWVREIFGLSRIEAEMNLLRFIPAKDRKPTFASWYKGPLTATRLRLEMPVFNPEDEIPTGIEYTTDDPMKEFYIKLLDYMGDKVISADPINRVDAPIPSDPVAAAMRKITDASKEEQPAWRRFKAIIPEASLLRIDREGQEPLVYTMTRDRWYDTKAFISPVLQDEDPSKGRVSVLEGVQTAYPRFMFRIPEAEVDEFADALVQAGTTEALTKIVERWGIRRSNPDFWAYLDTMKEYIRRRDPTRAGTLDVDRYLNL